jgi:hypothetical protein
MRLWSLHPRYLDARGLVALWREALLAQAVLRGRTIGYRNHPQLQRFGARASPAGSIAEYLRGIHVEAASRGYRFDATKIGGFRASPPIPISRGQLLFEWRHLIEKLEARDPRWRGRLTTVTIPLPHPLFRVVRGGVAPWEKGRAATASR